MFADLKLGDFLMKVAAKTPTPGGGAVSAVVGALGAALGVMAARYSGAAEAEAALAALQAEFMPLADEDSEAYGHVNRAMSLPKSTPEEKKRRKEVLQGAFVEAAEVPLRGMGMALRGLEALAALAPNCSRHLTSDLSGAARFLAAALEGCGENVGANAAALADAETRSRLERAREDLQAGARRLLADVEAGVRSVLGGA